MPDLAAPFTIAAAQAAPVFLDREATVEKACALIAEAGRAGAKLLAFPETFIPTYPLWVWNVPAGESRLLNDLYAELAANAVAVPSESTERLGQAARETGVCVAMGINECERDGAGGATLYNTLVYIDDAGRVVGKHRKLVPTGGERLVWGQGDGSTLGVHALPFARVGGLICWENYMPLARYAMYAWGAQIYVAPTWDRGEPWLSTLRHIAKEGRVYVIGCCSAMRRDDIPERYEALRRVYAGGDEWLNPGDSAIVDPNGKLVAGPSQRREEILYAEVDPRLLVGPKRQLDVVGHYARPDVFELTVNRDARPVIRER